MASGGVKGAFSKVPVIDLSEYQPGKNSAVVKELRRACCEVSSSLSCGELQNVAARREEEEKERKKKRKERKKNEREKVTEMKESEEMTHTETDDRQR